MKRLLSLVVAISLAGCGTTVAPPRDAGTIAVVASPLEPAAQIHGGNASYAEGAVVGAAGGAGIGAMSAKASAGLLCTFGGPLCLIVMVPAAIVGGLVGGVAGAAVDAVTSDPGKRIAHAREAIDQAVADMRLTAALAAKTAAQADLSLNAEKADSILEVGVDELQILAREKEMALLLKGRSRLYRNVSGEVIDERTAEARTEFRKYQDWAANEAQPLRQAVDTALADLSRALSAAASRPRADTAARQGG